MHRKISKKVMGGIMTAALIICLMIVAPVTAEAGSNWAHQSSPTATDLNSICYGNSAYVAVGDGGTILTSESGSSWTTRSSGVAANLLSVCTNGSGTFVAVGASGTVVYSTNNGVSWATATLGGSNTTACVCYGNGLYTAFFGAVNYTSTNGSSWSASGYNAGGNIYDVTYSSSGFMAVGTVGGTLYCSNGASWAVSSGSSELRTICSTSTAAYSMAAGTSGNIWMVFYNGFAVRETGSSITYNFNGSVFGNLDIDDDGTDEAFFVYVGSDSAGNGAIMISETATSFEDKTSFILGGSSVLNDVCYGGAIFVAVGNSGTILTSGGVATPPQFTSGSSASFSENATRTVYTAAATPSNGTTVTYTLDGSGDAGLFNISATTGAVTFKSAPDYENPSDADHNNVYIITVTATDASMAASRAVGITVNNVLEAPYITSASTGNFSENDTGTVYQGSATDPDNGTLSWAMGGTDAGCFTLDGATGAVVFKTVPDYEAPADTGLNNTYNITLTVTDSGGQTASQSIAITVTDINDAPVITSGAAVSVQENSTATGYTASATDQESNTVTWSITGGDDAARFNINNGTGTMAFVSAPDCENPSDSDANNQYNVTITATDNGATPAASSKAVTVTVTNENESAPTVMSDAAVSFNENATSVAYTAAAADSDTGDSFTWSLEGMDAALFDLNAGSGNVTFKTSPDYENPSDSNGDNIYEITVKATDSGGLAGTLDVTVTVMNIADGPTVTVNTGLTVTEDAAAATIANTVLSASCTDPAALVYIITALPVKGELKNNGTTLSSGDSFTQADLNSGLVSYTPSPNASGGDSFGFSAAEGTGDSTTGSFAVQITAVNDAPVLAATNGTTSFTEGNNTASTPVAVDSGITAADADNMTLASATVSVTGNFAADEDVLAFANTSAVTFGDIGALYNAATGVLTMTSPGATAVLAQWQAALRAVTYANISETPAAAARTITFSVSDGSISSSGVTKDVSVTAVNDTPTDISLSAALIGENAPSGTTVGTLSATDADSAVFTYELVSGTGDTGNSSFSIVGSTLKTNGALDYETAGSLSIRVRATDGGTSLEKAVTVTVANVNEAPTDILLSSGSIDEGRALGTTVGSFTASDPDSGDTFTYTLADNIVFPDNTSFVITGSALMTNTVLDYSVKSSYTIRIRSSDALGLYTEKTFTVTVNEVNAAPTDISLTSSSVTENTPGGAAIGTLSSTDPNTTDSFTYSLTLGFGDNAGFTVAGDHLDQLKLSAVPDFETKNSYSVKIRTTDAGGLYCEKIFAITVTDVNEAPAVTSGAAASIAENGTGTVYTAVGSDPDTGDSITWSLGGADAALLDINAGTGEVTFKEPQNYERPEDGGSDNIYDITVIASDSHNLTGAKNVAITVTNADEAPVITSGASVSFAEGGTGQAYKATGNDPEGAAVTWSVSGTDSSLFDIDSTTGVLTFNAAPSFSVPADSDADNVYNLNITASDGGLTTSKAVTVEVTHAAIYPYHGNNTSVEVNGAAYAAGKMDTKTSSSGQTVTTVTIDTDQLHHILDQQESGATVTIPITTDSDVAAAAMTGDMISTLQGSGATLVIRTDSASYTVPANNIDLNGIAQQFGDNVEPADILVSVTISEPADTTARIVADAANEGGFALVVPAVDFSVTCVYNGQTVGITSYDSYVRRTVAIPDGIDPAKITTGVVIEPDGTVRHVPTKVVLIDGKYYAVINSMTNSTYTVIWHPVEFSDITDSWAKDAINNMGSRMVITGVDGVSFKPFRDTTRAEFAAIVVRALGLEQGMGTCELGDVKSADWYYGYVETAVGYGLVRGDDDGAFHPNNKITREEAMVIIARAMTLTKLNPILDDTRIAALLASYPDGTGASSWACAGIAACLDTGIITGRTSATLCPKENITRAEVAAIVERLLQKSDLI